MSSPHSVYLLLGPEEGEKDLFIQRLIKTLSKNGEKPEIHRFYPFDTDMVEMLSVLRNGTLFSLHRLVLFYNADELKKPDLQLLKTYIDHPAEQATLLLLSSRVGGIDRQLENLIPKKNKVIFWELFDNQKLGWILNFFKKKGLSIDNQAASFLLDMVENNTRELKIICEKLALYFGEGARLDVAEIESLIYHSKEENVYTLFDRVAQRDLGAALEVLQKIRLSHETDPVQLLSGLTFQFRKCLRFAGLIQNNYQGSEAFSRLNIRSKRIQRVYQTASAQYSAVELERIILLISRFDLLLRSLKASIHAELLQLFLYYTIVRGGLWIKLD